MIRLASQLLKIMSNQACFSGACMKLKALQVLSSLILTTTLYSCGGSEIIPPDDASSTDDSVNTDAGSTNTNPVDTNANPETPNNNSGGGNAEPVAPIPDENFEEHILTVFDFESENRGIFKQDVFGRQPTGDYSVGGVVADADRDSQIFQVSLGGVDAETVENIAGAFVFSVQSTGEDILGLSFDYRLTQTSEYEDDEISSVFIGVDGRQSETPIVQIRGDGNGGEVIDSGWQSVSVNLGNLTAGEHTIVVGALNNKKTFDNEATVFQLDDIVLSQASSVSSKREAGSGEVLGGASAYSDPQASGGLGVEITEEVGSGIRLDNIPASRGLSLVYQAETAGEISLRINGKSQSPLVFSATGIGEYQTLSRALPIVAGSRVELIFQPNNTPINIDYVEFDAQPELALIDVVVPGSPPSGPINTSDPVVPVDPQTPELRRCQSMPQDAAPAVFPVLRIPLAVHVGGSALSDDDICGIMEEMNNIWYAQAGICFEMELDRVFFDMGNPQIDRASEKRSNILNFWLLRDNSLFPTAQSANGVYLGGRDEAYTMDRPGLNTGGVVTRSRFAAARTGAHELGHALSLGHQNCGAACYNLLMTSGRRGFEIVTGVPASVNEVQRARNTAVSSRRRALGDTSSNFCSPPRFID